MHEIRLFRVALMYFTRIPVGEIKGFKAVDIKHAARYFPWVGALIGAINAAVYMVTVLIFDQTVAVLLAMATSFILTGCLHEGGLADTVDGYLGGYTVQQKLEMIKDSRQSSYGVVAVWTVLTLKWLLLSRLDPVSVPLVMVIGHTFSRFTPILMIKALSYVRDEDNQEKPLKNQLTWRDIGIAALIMVPAFLIRIIMSLTSLVVILVAFFLFTRVTKRQIGGYTGHVLGANQQISELLVYIIWLALA